MPASLRLSRWFAAAAAISGFTTCGAGDAPAPYQASPYAETQCGAVDDYIPKLLAFARGNGFAGVAAAMQNDIVPSGTIRNALSAGIVIAKKAPPPSDLTITARTFFENPEIDPLFKLVKGVLSYIAGHAPATRAHYDLGDVLSSAIAQCSPDTTLLLVEKLSTTRLPAGCSPAGPTCRLAANLLIESSRALLADPALKNVFGSLTLAAIPEDGFVVLMQQVTRTLTSPNFRFSDIRSLISTNVYPLIADANLKAKLDVLLDLLEALTAPELGILDPLKQTLACFDARDPSGTVPRLLHALVVNPEFKLTEIESALIASQNADRDEKFVAWVGSVAALLRKDGASRDGLLSFAGRVLQTKNASLIVPDLLSASDAGVVDDLRNLFSKLDSQCSRVPTQK